MSVAPDPIALRNAANARFSTGPRTPEGKAISSTNAVDHGFCSVEPKTPEDRAEAAALYAMLAAELKPATPMEIEAVRNAAHADQRCRRIGRALEDVGQASIVRRADERKQKLSDEQEQARAEVAFWKAILEHPPAVGEGLKPAVLAAVLNRFGVGVKGRAEDCRANLVQFLQIGARGDALFAEAVSAREALAPGETLAEELRQSIDQAGKDCEGLTEVFGRCLDEANRRLAEAKQRVAQNEARPRRDDDWFDDSKRTQLLFRYKAEAERGYYRALRSLDAIRRRQDAERRQNERDQRQARKAAQEAEKASRQAARQAEIDAKARPQRNELAERVVQAILAKSPLRNEPRSTAAPTEPEARELVGAGVSSAASTPEGPRTVRRRGREVVIDPRRPPNRR
ncbi:MAG: hypothetical protein U0800_18655 [Isosphaeraceae bacterium]